MIWGLFTLTDTFISVVVSDLFVEWVMIKSSFDFRLFSIDFKIPPEWPRWKRFAVAPDQHNESGEAIGAALGWVLIRRKPFVSSQGDRAADATRHFEGFTLIRCQLRRTSPGQCARDQQHFSSLGMRVGGPWPANWLGSKTRAALILFMAEEIREGQGWMMQFL